MADDIRRLLDYIVTQYAVRDEQRAIDQDANAAEGGDVIASDKAQAVSRTEEQADDLAGPFREGLVMAWARRSQGDGAIQLDDRDPEQDRIADALIQFLVSYDLAESHSEATGPRNYIYTIAIDWPRLNRVAQAAGVQLDAALADARP
jgi:hypothetical protein